MKKQRLEYWKSNKKRKSNLGGMVFFISVLFCALAYINFYYAQRIEAQMQYEEMKPVETLKARNVQEVLPEAGSEEAAMEEARQAEDNLDSEKGKYGGF